MITKDDLKMYEMSIQDVSSYKKLVNDLSDLITKYESVTRDKQDPNLVSFNNDLNIRISNVEVILSKLN